MNAKRKNDEINNSFLRGLLIGAVLIAFALLGFTIWQTGILADEGTTFYVTTRLGSKQLEETVHVYISDELVATLYINNEHPIDTVALKVPQDGVFGYQIESETFVSYSRIGIQGEGKGKINIEAGDTFFVYYRPMANSEEWVMSLREH